VHGEAATCLFLSLFQNAVRFSPADGAIEIAARRTSDGARVIVTVRDHGPGIAPEHREKVFEPFFTTAVDGLGMGLFVASRIADLQDIRLGLATCGEGTAFEVALPVADASDVRATADGETAAGGETTGGDVSASD
jgi:signal transduction histidine kinase